VLRLGKGKLDGLIVVGEVLTGTAGDGPVTLT